MPATPPPSHQRGRSRSNATATHSLATGQVSRSSGVALPRWSELSRTGEHAVSWAAMTRPSLPAPNSQPSRDTCTTKRIKHRTLARNRCR
jgi:hypothetical protein